MKREHWMIALAVVGIAAISYGMINENHPIFVLGILCAIGAYLLIRKKLKDSLQNRS